MTTPSNPRAISTAREERIREENAACTLDGASVGPEADVRDLLAQLDHERAEFARVTRALATTRAAYDTDLAGLRDELRKYMDAAALQREERRLTATEGEIAQGRLLNLLARVHRDGGHYVSAHGVEKACEDADEIVAGLLGEKRSHEALRTAVQEYLRGIPQPCGACKGRGMVLAGREVEEACDECVARDTLATLAGGGQ